MKKLSAVLFCVSLCITIAVFYPCLAACEEPLQICNCDTGVMNMEIPATGTEMTVTMSALIEECASGAKNLGNFQSCVSKLTIGWQKDGLITGREKGAIHICAAQFTPVETVDYVDVVRFTGLWYQIARYFNPAEGDIAAVTAEYSLNDDGITLGVLNKGRFGGLDGPEVTIEGIARVVDAETNSKLAVTFTDPPVQREFEFWIIELGEDYSYAVVTNSVRSVLYIISRTSTMEESVYQDIIDRLAMLCFDPEKIILTPQPEA